MDFSKFCSIIQSRTKELPDRTTFTRNVWPTCGLSGNTKTIDLIFEHPFPGIRGFISNLQPRPCCNSDRISVIARCCPSGATRVTRYSTGDTTGQYRGTPLFPVLYYRGRIQEPFSNTPTDFGVSTPQSLTREVSPFQLSGLGVLPPFQPSRSGWPPFQPPSLGVTVSQLFFASVIRSSSRTLSCIFQPRRGCNTIHTFAAPLIKPCLAIR